jgi:transcriptional regulator with XRE-family HTH domain
MRDDDVSFDWREAVRVLGAQQRRIREFLGLSQEALARHAGVSQAALSRLETGRGLATPLIIVLKIRQALARELSYLDPTFLNAKLLETLDLSRWLAEASEPSSAPRAAQGVEEIVALYQEMPEEHRGRFVTFLRAAGSALREADHETNQTRHSSTCSSKE